MEQLGGILVDGFKDMIEGIEEAMDSDVPGEDHAPEERGSRHDARHGEHEDQAEHSSQHGDEYQNDDDDCHHMEHQQNDEDREDSACGESETESKCRTMSEHVYQDGHGECTRCGFQGEYEEPQHDHYGSEEDHHDSHHGDEGDSGEQEDDEGEDDTYRWDGHHYSQGKGHDDADDNNINNGHKHETDEEGWDCPECGAYNSENDQDHDGHV